MITEQQVDSLKEIIESPGPCETIRRLMIVARTRDDARRWAERVMLLLPHTDRSPSSLNNIPCISRSILPFLQEKSYQPQDDERWARDQLQQVVEWRDSLPRGYSSTPGHSWLLAISSELLQPQQYLRDCHWDKVPIKYRIEAVAHLLKPVFHHIARGHEAAGTGSKYTLHTIGVDCFYHSDTTSAGDLARYFPIWSNEPELFPPEYFENDRRRWHHVEVDAETLARELRKDGSIAEDALFGRVLLVKRALGELRTRENDERVTVAPRKLLKEGDVVLFAVEGTNPALYWCKFGSTSLLKTEKSRLSNMRDSSLGIRQFLYEISAIDSLEADYTSVLVSSHQGTYEREPQQLEDWLRDSERSARDIVEAFKEIDRFFDILHIEPMDAAESPRPKFLSSLGCIYERLLATRRSEPFRDSDVIPVSKNSRGGDKLLYIRPRDVRGQVEFYLENIRSKNLTILSWECKDWRWRLWKEGIEEENRVQRNGKLRIDSKTRYTNHVRGVNEKYPGVFPSIGSALSRINRNGRIRSFWLDTDLFPAWLHGDFHPRNVLLVPDNFGRIGTLESKKWELKVIDLANAILKSEGDDRAPLAFDFVTFEVDMKAKALFDAPAGAQDWSERDVLHSLTQAEKKIWDWCLRSLPNCDTALRQNETNRDAVPEPWFPTKEQLPDLPIPAFSKVVLWRHLALFRLDRAAAKAKNKTEQDALTLWTPLRSYAQALFFYSIAYLAFLNPKKGEDRKQALTCLVSAEVAADLLDRRIAEGSSQ